MTHYTCSIVDYPNDALTPQFFSTQTQFLTKFCPFYKEKITLETERQLMRNLLIRFNQAVNGQFCAEVTKWWYRGRILLPAYSFFVDW